VSKRRVFFRVVGYFIIVLAGLTAGRSSVIGFIFGLLYLLVCGELFRSAQIFLSMCVCVLCSFIFVALTPVYSFVVDVFLPYAFEYIFSFLDGRGGEIESTNVLGRMYWSLDSYRGWLGYGRYSDGDHTFMYTDGGYMRNVLMFGYIGAFVVVICNLGVFYTIYRLSLIYVRRKKLTRLFLLLFLLYSLLHYKGDVLLHLVGAQIFLMSFLALLAVRFVSQRQHQLALR